MSGDFTKHQRNSTQRKVITFYLIFKNKTLKLWNQAPVTANDTFQKAFITDLVQTKRIRSVSNTGGEHNCQISRMSALQKAFLDSDRKLLRMPGTDKSADTDSRAIRYHRYSLFKTDYLTHFIITFSFTIYLRTACLLLSQGSKSFRMSDPRWQSSLRIPLPQLQYQHRY